MARVQAALGKAEDIEHASLGGRRLQVLHGVHEAQRRSLVARVEVAGYDRTCPAADAGEDGDILVAIRPLEGGRLPDDPRRRLELPEKLARASVERLEPAFHVSVEDDVA